MSIATEQELKTLIEKNKQQQMKLSDVLKYEFQQLKAQNDLEGCLNTLIAATTVLQEEHHKTIKAISELKNELATGISQMIDAANQIKDIKIIPLAIKQQPKKQRNQSIIEKIKGCAALLFLGLCITSSFVGIFYLLNRLFDLNIL
ncbi:MULTISPECIES: hypothetical protein [Cysteiniphilum]|uniref:Uncharacterized protein n=1 Tax=Cysteiniphilum litorale TaxID=2056700 RepID=A0A8J2Z7B9_9GAMM|nr:MULTISPECIES: hypothetical protein [Cysteiniphilum]GGG09284.1 hypothetical protein GCM10010995_28630 [Cysteiniphilum litorale]